jgi:hypothetical protein
MSRGVIAWSLMLLAERQAFALCPNCLGQKATWDAQSGVLAVFLVVPFVAAYVAWRVIAASLRPSADGRALQGEARREARNEAAAAVSRKSASDRTK